MWNNICTTPHKICRENFKVFKKAINSWKDVFCNCLEICCIYIIATNFEYPYCNCFYGQKIRLSYLIIYDENESILHNRPKNIGFSPSIR